MCTIMGSPDKFECRSASPSETTCASESASPAVGKSVPFAEFPNSLEGPEDVDKSIVATSLCLESAAHGGKYNMKPSVGTWLQMPAKVPKTAEHDDDDDDDDLACWTAAVSP